ncbi:MAG: beta-ketoacyl synthase chain length factor [Bacteroidia bacterium]
MLYIHHTSCISSQQTFSDIDLNILNESVENKLVAHEIIPPEISQNVLRRMGKAAKMSVGAALPLMKKIDSLDGIILGTANGGMEDCIRFMNQIIQYNEGMLTPGNFVQSTPNGLAAQLGLLQSNKKYNITHVHRGLSFENALIDAGMMLKEYPKNTYLLGGVDEISSFNYNIDFLGGWYKKEIVSNKDLYKVNSTASIAGEGAAMFIVSNDKTNATAELKSVHILHNEDPDYIIQELKTFLNEYLKNKTLDILITGENGDNRFLNFYGSVEKQMDKKTIILRFKHMSGEYPTASSQALWLACSILKTQSFPEHMIKKATENKEYRNILIYNNYKGAQHSFMLISKPV